MDCSYHKPCHVQVSETSNWTQLSRKPAGVLVTIAIQRHNHVFSRSIFTALRGCFVTYTLTQRPSSSLIIRHLIISWSPRNQRHILSSRLQYSISFSTNVRSQTHKPLRASFTNCLIDSFVVVSPFLLEWVYSFGSFPNYDISH